VSVVALFVDERAETIGEILEAVPIDIIQFHGEESPAFCARFGRPYIKALRVKATPKASPKASMAIVEASRAYTGARGILLDAWQEGVPGGTGKTFDWDLARGKFPRPLVLAGGLNAENVARAIERVRPAAVDVSGGVEQAPGIKSAAGIKDFIAAVRTADQRLDGR
jgi:phosphoribosylanthranilate isomerase